MVPLIKTLKNCSEIKTLVCVTAQHRQMLDQVLNIFDITPDFDLDIMQENQSLADITTRALKGVMQIIEKSKADLVLVHGDTTTTLAASLAAYYSGIKLGHVEAGLRTYDKYQPYPEEINRRLVADLADLNFAPTAISKENLLKENINPESIFVTGNTAIDLIKYTLRKDFRFNCNALNNINFKNRIITMTAHRRENYGKPFENICHAVQKLVENFPDLEIIYPVHLSPNVRDIVFKILGNNKRIHLIDPLDIQDLHNLFALSTLVMTDSGGIQEEAPAFNIPTLVLRNVTERPEGLQTGCLALAGTDTENIYNIASQLLTNPTEYSRMANAPNPFGDGKASERILQAILYHFNKTISPPMEFII